MHRRKRRWESLDDEVLQIRTYPVISSGGRAVVGSRSGARRLTMGRVTEENR
jgi:hypothetical protein